MPISNPNPQSKDVVIVQRDDTNSYWGEAHISGSNLLFYIDANGHISADFSESFYNLFPPPSGSSGGSSGTTLVTGGLYQVTSSWAINVVNASTGSGTTLVTGGLYQITASWAVNAVNAGTTLVTGGLYLITSSWAQTSSWALNSINSLLASFAVSSSWASQSLSSSAINILTTSSNANFYVPFVISSSYQRIFIDPSGFFYNPSTEILTVNNISSSAITASLFGTASWAINTVNGGSGTTLVTGGLYQVTSSWAINAVNAGTTLITGATYPITASWAINSINSVTSTTSTSSLFASSSVSSSNINILSTASNANFYVPFVITNSYQPVYIDPNSIFYNPGTDTLTVNNISSSAVTASLFGTASWAINTVNGGSGTTLVTGGLYQITSSWAQTASWAINTVNGGSSGTTLVTGGLYQITSSWAQTASYALNTVMDIIQIQVFS